MGKLASLAQEFDKQEKDKARAQAQERADIARKKREDTDSLTKVSKPFSMIGNALDDDNYGDFVEGIVQEGSKDCWKGEYNDTSYGNNRTYEKFARVLIYREDNEIKIDVHAHRHDYDTPAPSFTDKKSFSLANLEGAVEQFLEYLSRCGFDISGIDETLDQVEEMLKANPAPEKTAIPSP